MLQLDYLIIYYYHDYVMSIMIPVHILSYLLAWRSLLILRRKSYMDYEMNYEPDHVILIIMLDHDSDHDFHNEDYWNHHEHN